MLVSAQQCVDSGGRIRQIFWVPPMYMCVGGPHNGEWVLHRIARATG
ncbi:hypothetical protein J1792_33545 [Streptomyces triculaminicus]|uniref:Uncharacterized protein n=2 Tax=Streptomyces TaxID=1883 RepID=A0A939JSB0_9ACTN|nr:MULTISPECIES: hypothetical protein [Streptomyces]MBO0657463.1 hypothetical protein [Streptomyces triculaminicus]QSY49582.1 hypothetical protein J3S04_32690 [Streptomyces griseocarneus]